MAWRIRICRRKCPNPSGKLEKTSFSQFRNLQKSKIEVFHDNPWNFHDPWVGTDTPGPGEAVFAIRFIQKTQIYNQKARFKKSTKKITKVKIARNPEGFQVPEVMDMNPTGLPELF